MLRDRDCPVMNIHSLIQPVDNFVDKEQKMACTKAYSNG
jgi:hypothetical protein